jgi:hypothetical protein
LATHSLHFTEAILVTDMQETLCPEIMMADIASKVAGARLVDEVLNEFITDE